MILSGLKPEKLYSYFEAITAIPRGSYNEAGIADYLCDFAKAHGLRFVRDKVHNVVIFKDASAGVDAQPVILQGHTDMVCEKLPEIEHDFLRDPIELIVEDGWIRANGTTLGADNGVAVAMMLAILDDETLAHPPLECVFTVCEETGLEGVLSLDPSILKGRKLINLDDGPEFFGVQSSAGSVRIDCAREASFEKCTGSALSVRIAGLSGGHSGAQIHEMHANAIRIAARLLRAVLYGGGVQLAAIRGGDMVNAIPRLCTFTVAGEDVEAALSLLETQRAQILEEIAVQEPEAEIEITQSDFSGEVVDIAGGQAFAALLDLAPDGVLSRDVRDNFTISSSNLGIVRLEEGQMRARFMPRASVDSLLYDSMDRLSLLGSVLGFEVSFAEVSPGWKYEEKSELRDILKRVSLEKFGREFTVGKIHAGLECGVFTSRIPGMDAISIGPRTQDIHTPKERLNIESFSITYEFVRAVLEDMAK
ncbi:MAG: beta-Ala-His dipeptidase [Oscillospiraceae bacterium]|nr:beta-Ala-His dipeptidase [Oscillospiraceae bacterium]MBQ3878767.1 beta-Ala-His dipeptidase [Oscillospiraceae bacterium]